VSATVVLGAAAIVMPEELQRYLGPFDPLVTVPTVIVAGAAALRYLDRSGRFAVWDPSRARRGVPVAVAAAAAFAVVAITADTLLGYPRDINVLVPDALLFYPAIAVVAETFFHLLPLTVLLAATRRRPVSAQTAGWLIVPVALLEPVFQLVAGSDPLSWLGLVTFINVLAFNLTQLELFRRHDFVTMLVLRLTYYLLWHIAWGSARLELLFS
jgi:hypothetical protein